MTDPIESPLDLFRQGMDYLDIAERFDATEATVERVIHRLRHAEQMEDRTLAAAENRDAMRMIQRKVHRLRRRAELREIRARHAV